ncbi:group I intron-associated PD-(D/E)XK endonuclease [Halobacteriales archaeon Cl-PHB]
MPSRPEHFEELDEPQRRGDATEAICIAEFDVRGYTILVPMHDNEPYDFLVEAGTGRFYRIQAKTAYEAPNEGAVRFETRSTRVKTDGYEREGYVDSIDCFAVYNPITDDVYVVPVEEAPPNQMTIRYEAPPSGYEDRVNWHEDYALDSFPEVLEG